MSRSSITHEYMGTLVCRASAKKESGSKMLGPINLQCAVLCLVTMCLYVTPVRISRSCMAASDGLRGAHGTIYIESAGKSDTEPCSRICTGRMTSAVPDGSRVAKCTERHDRPAAIGERQLLSLTLCWELGQAVSDPTSSMSSPWPVACRLLAFVIPSRTAHTNIKAQHQQRCRATLMRCTTREHRRYL